jgi:tetratricopeptide (TPR) repeat protein
MLRRRLLGAIRDGALAVVALSLSLSSAAFAADDEEEEPASGETISAPSTPSTAPATNSPPDAIADPVEQKTALPQESREELLATARDLVRRKKYREAKEPFKKALIHTPDDQALLAEYCTVCENNRDWSTAAATYEKLFALNPAKEKELYSDYAQTLWELRKYDKATVALKKAIGFGKDKDKSYRTLIKIALVDNDKVLAEDYYQEYFKAAPKDSDMRLECAKWLQSRGKIKEAIPHYKAASDCRPQDAQLHQTLAYILLTEKDYSGSIQEYERAMAADPKITPQMQSSIRYVKQLQGAGKGTK